MSLNMKTLQQAFAKTAAVIEKTVQTTVQEVTGPKPLQDYELLTQIGSAGPGLIWKLYSAKPIRGSTIPQQYPTVTVWLLDKKAVSEARQRAGLSKAVEDAFYELIRGDAGRLVRLRHPGVVHVVMGLDENKNAMAMVTEPLFASVANALGKLENVAKVPNELKGMEIGLLEVKHGMLQIAESLDFLHNQAHLIHRAVSPEEYDVEDSVLPLQPSLNYTAPELVRNKSSSAGCVSDIFSFGCLAFHLITHKPLFDCKNNVKMYTNTLTYISTQTFSSIPVELVPDLQRMLSTNETSRPTAVEFTGSSFFRDDTRLRALRFLDHMLERDNIQKSEFLKALSDMWKDFDSRVLRYKVLPPLCAELRNVVMQPMILPMVLTIAESQDKNDFELTTLPALVPVLSTAAGDTLLLLVKHADLIISKTSQEQLILHVLPFIVRAYDDTDARMQEEVLKKSISLAKQLDAQLVKQAILPRVHGLALKTTVATVRANALLCLGDLVHTLDKPAVLEILQTIQRCTAVDHSAPTLMCTLGVANAILKQYGVEFVAEHVLPLLVPLLTAQQLNVQQFAKYMLFVKDILRKIEEKRGVSVTDSGVPQMKPSVSADGLQSEALKRSSGNAPSTIKSSPYWGPPSKESNASKIISTSMPITVSSTSHQVQVTSLPPQSSMISAAINQQSPQSVASVDIEWPPQPSSGVNQLPGITEKQNHDGGFPSSSSFDDLDPFANWPSRPSGLLNGPVSSSNGSAGAPASRYGSTSGLSTSNSWGFDNLTSIEPSRQTGSTLNSGSLNNMSLNSQSSIGFSKQTQGIYTSGTYFNDKKPMTLAPYLLLVRMRPVLLSLLHHQQLQLVEEEAEEGAYLQSHGLEMPDHQLNRHQ